ncbi:hypothetical protein Tco_0880849 [Tanacetum coccineum]
MFKVDRIEDRVKCYNCYGICHIARNCTQHKRPQNTEYFKDKMLLMQAQENRVALDEDQLLFLTGGQDNIVDKDVDEPPVQDLALNVDNVFQADDYLVYDEAGPSYDLDILSEVYDHDHYQDAVCEHHEEHEMCNTPKNVSQRKYVRRRYFIIQQLKIQENDSNCHL